LEFRGLIDSFDAAEQTHAINTSPADAPFNFAASGKLIAL
jgi:hypothetical protein